MRWYFIKCWNVILVNYFSYILIRTKCGRNSIWTLEIFFSKTEPTPSSVNSKLESNQFNKCLSRSLQSWVDQGRVNAAQGWVDGSIKKFSAPLMAWNQLRHHHPHWGPQNYCNELPNDNMIIDQDHNYHDHDRLPHHHRHLHYYCHQNHHGCQWRWCQKIAAGSELLPQNWVYKSNLDLLWNVKSQLNKGEMPIMINLKKIRTGTWTFSPLPRDHQNKLIVHTHIYSYRPL